MENLVKILIGLGIGLVGGILSGLFGIGGGVVVVPALLLLGFTQREASGTSLAALLLPVGLLGVIEYARRHEIHFHYGIGIALGLMIGVLGRSDFGRASVERVAGAAVRRVPGGGGPEVPVLPQRSKLRHHRAYRQRYAQGLTERITPRQFHEAVGVEDWRVLANNACAYFRTGSFPKGVELVAAIDKLADAANHHPDVDVATWMGRD